MTGLTRRTFLCRLSIAGTAGLMLLEGCGLPRAGAQATRIPRIGYLVPAPREGLMANRVDAFLQGLRQFGWIENQTINIEWRLSTNGRNDLLPELAAELVRLPVDVLVASSGTPAVLAAKEATRTIPVVTTGVSNPVETGIVANLARPGGNVTGLSTSAPGLYTKWVELLREVVPGLARVAVLLDSSNPGTPSNWDQIRVAADQSGVRAEAIELRSAEEGETAFVAAVSSRADAALDDNSSLVLQIRDRYAALALQHRLPVITVSRDYVAAGVLMCYGPNRAEIYRQAAVYVDKILKGARPAELPMEQPAIFDLAVNVKTLQALGLTISASVQPLVTEWL